MSSPKTDTGSGAATITLGALRRRLTAMLDGPLGHDEAEATVRAILEDGAGYSRLDTVLHDSRPLEPFTAERLTAMAQRVADGTPVQYVTGHARFYGLDFHVTPDVLIPRPETEGLVDRIVDAWASRSDLRVLDLCTGSGCIAIALARSLPFARVEAVDISAPALAVAEDNARRLSAKVAFSRADVLHLEAPAEPTYDIIVSNPPYIADSERADMDHRVLLHEPEQALFVPDADPMRFYMPIAQYAARALRPGGRLYFEINSLYAEQTADCLADAGLTDVRLDRDFCGRMRYASASRPAD